MNCLEKKDFQFKDFISIVWTIQEFSKMFKNVRERIGPDNLTIGQVQLLYLKSVKHAPTVQLLFTRYITVAPFKGKMF